MRVYSLLGCSLLLLTSASCSYLKNRGADLLDIVTLEVGAGVGAHVGLKVTDAVGVVLGYNEQTVYALHGRYAGTGTRSSRGFLALAQSRIQDSGAEMVPLVGNEPYYSDTGGGYLVVSDPLSNIFPVPLMGATPRDPLVDQKERWEQRLHRTFDVYAEASVGIGMHVGVSPGDFLDFLLGWFGVDLAGDEIAAGDG